MTAFAPIQIRRFTRAEVCARYHRFQLYLIEKKRKNNLWPLWHRGVEL